MFCSKCGSRQPDDAQFCASCGSIMNRAYQQKTMGLQENVASLLCYLIGWITGLIFYLLEPSNKTIRFHALQSILLCVTVFIIYAVLGILRVIFEINMLGFLFFSMSSSTFGLLVFVLWILLMVQAYQGQKWKLPVIGNLAEQWASK
ncbi:MAG: DUF4870 domain-containing protein [Dehalococcoidia bacterium]|nr:DUF4870 domain-containing protein [Dehalococcoidia bacterium]